MLVTMLGGGGVATARRVAVAMYDRDRRDDKVDDDKDDQEG
jgi:hypothetical protein